MGMHDDTELALIPKAILIAAAEYVEDLANEWEWKRNSIPRNDMEMANIDLMISKLRQYSTPSNDLNQGRVPSNGDKL